MKIVFIVIGVENLAVEFLSSFLKDQGHKVELIFDPRLFASEAIQIKKLAGFFDTSKEIARQVVEKQPDLVGFSVFTLNYQRALLLAKKIKSLNKKIPIIFGGIHPTSVPEVVMGEKFVDMVCVGEGEYALLELLESMKDKKPRFDIKNIWFKKDGRIVKNICRSLIKDLDKVPFLDKDLFYKIHPAAVKNDYYTITSRGCPFACTYCANNVLQKINRNLGLSIRRRSPKNIIKELLIAKERYNPKQITFPDDVFVQDINWLREFVKLYKKSINLPYTMLTHSRFTTYEIVKMLKDSGCFLLAFGIQSASEKTRREVLKRYETNEEIKLAAENCHKIGLKFSVDHIFNIPTEGVAEQEIALRFYNELRPSVINSYWLQYFPRTEIINTAVGEGIIRKSMISRIEQGLTSSSFVVGIGGKDSFNADLFFANFQFFFMLLPLLPKRLMDIIIAKKWYNLPFKPPILLNIGIKFLINMTQKRGYVYLDMIKNTGYFMIKNFLLKLKYFNLIGFFRNNK